jgi:hypothetical protein
MAVPPANLHEKDLEPIAEIRGWAESLCNKVFRASPGPQLPALQIKGFSFSSLFDIQMLFESSDAVWKIS